MKSVMKKLMYFLAGIGLVFAGMAILSKGHTLTGYSLVGSGSAIILGSVC